MQDRLKSKAALHEAVRADKVLPPLARERGAEVNFTADSYSQSILLEIAAPGEAQFLTVSVTGDGNCLFNAASIHVIGNESLAQELRVRTSLEMLHNEDLYQSNNQESCFV